MNYSKINESIRNFFGRSNKYEVYSEFPLNEISIPEEYSEYSRLLTIEVNKIKKQLNFNEDIVTVIRISDDANAYALWNVDDNCNAIVINSGLLDIISFYILNIKSFFLKNRSHNVFKKLFHENHLEYIEYYSGYIFRNALRFVIYHEFFHLYLRHKNSSAYIKCLGLSEKIQGKYSSKKKALECDADINAFIRLKYFQDNEFLIMKDKLDNLGPAELYIYKNISQDSDLKIFSLLISTFSFYLFYFDVSFPSDEIKISKNLSTHPTSLYRIINILELMECDYLESSTIFNYSLNFSIRLNKFVLFRIFIHKNRHLLKSNKMSKDRLREFKYFFESDPLFLYGINNESIKLFDSTKKNMAKHMKENYNEISQNIKEPIQRVKWF